MISYERIRYLSDLAGLKLKYINNVPTGVVYDENASRDIICPYETFKSNMRLDDLPLQWMLGQNNFIAGGAVLSWIWGERFEGQDTDFFFFANESTFNSADDFIYFLNGIGFVEVNMSAYARTLIDPSTRTTVQVVTYLNSHVPQNAPLLKHLDTFDFDLCKFAVDKDQFYTTTGAVFNFLIMSLFVSQPLQNNRFFSRVLKYHKRGFYLTEKIWSKFS